MTLPAAASPLAASDTLELVAWLRRARAPEKRPSISSLWIKSGKAQSEQMRSRLPRKGTAGLHANDLRHRAGLVCRTATALRLPVGSIKRRLSGAGSASFRSSA